MYGGPCNNILDYIKSNHKRVVVGSPSTVHIAFTLLPEFTPLGGIFFLNRVEAPSWNQVLCWDI